jgi:type VI secretion system secreted protein VgrG
VDRDELIMIRNNRIEVVGGNEYYSVTHARTHWVGDYELIFIGQGGQVISNQGGEGRLIQGNLGIFVNGDEMKLFVGNSKLTMMKDGSIELSGKSIKLIGTEEVKLSAPTIESSGQKEVKMGAGSSTMSVKPEGATTSAAKIDSTAIGIHTISGAVIKLN